MTRESPRALARKRTYGKQGYSVRQALQDMIGEQGIDQTAVKAAIAAHDALQSVKSWGTRFDASSMADYPLTQKGQVPHVPQPQRRPKRHSKGALTRVAAHYQKVRLGPSLVPHVASTAKVRTCPKVGVYSRYEMAQGYPELPYEGLARANQADHLPVGRERSTLAAHEMLYRAQHGVCASATEMRDMGRDQSKTKDQQLKDARACVARARAKRGAKL